MHRGVLELVAGVLRQLPDHLAVPDPVGSDDDVDRAGRERVGCDGAVDDVAVGVLDLDRELGPVHAAQVLDRRVGHLADRHLDRRRRLRVVERQVGRPRHAREDVGDGHLVGDRDLDLAGGGVGRGRVGAGEQRRRTEAEHGSGRDGDDGADSDLTLAELLVLEDVQGSSLSVGGFRLWSPMDQTSVRALCADNESVL